MAVTADSVVVELLAKTDGYTANINGAASTSQSGMSKIEKAAAQAEAQVQESAAAMGGAFKRAANDIEAGSARAANASRNLGRQISDIGVGLTGGQNPFLILSQQAPQVADALADTGGKAAAVATFFAGPWGAALLAAGSALGILLGKALEGGETIESLTAKLADTAQSSRMAEQAEVIFARSLEGAADASAKLNEKLKEQNQTQLQVAQSALAAAAALRQTTIQNLRAELAQASLAQAEVRRENGGFSTAATAGGAGAAAANSQRYFAAKQREADADKRVALARRAVAEAQGAVVQASIPLLDMRAAAASDKSAAATDRHAQALGRLRDAYVAAQTAAKTNEQREAAARRYREGRTRIDTNLAAEQKAIAESERKKRGPSAEVLARRAEAQRVREVRNNEAYNTEMESLNQAIIQASRLQEVDAGKLAEYSRQEVESALAKRNAQIDADESAKKYSAEQADNLRRLAKQAADIQLLNINSEEVRRRADEQKAIAQTQLNADADQLQATLGISESLDERKRLERQLLDIRFKQLRIEQDAILKDTTGRYSDAQRKQAQITKDSLPALESAGRTAIDQRYRSPYERYRRSIDGVDNLNASIDAVKVDALEAVTDELTRATTAALGLKGAFGQIVGELIRIGIQRKIIGPLADSLFGKADGSTSGAVGGLFSSIGKLFGRASGGYVAPGQTVRVNEGRGGVELLRMGAQGGTVIPLGQKAAAQAVAGTTVLQTIQVDARGAVMNDQFAAQILTRAGQDARQVVQATNDAARKGLPAAQRRFGQLGTTG
ncbi:phage tail length tape measure family protein [Sphingomonas abaci]|uniref:Bacteriophage tail tape measure N-terminal domain-containing protein n=1 Tax=Sphingomonas abaci TaxID=237611 RepID=A0A7W7AH37_9SPHN|nr:phage tail length tape measure family protein [Sphingomonas abaci]MBB4616903.1 hypothetical protein [Sphingomonas abaci]